MKDVSVHFRIDYFDEVRNFEKIIEELPDVLVSSSLIRIALMNSLVKLRHVRKSVKTTLERLQEEVARAGEEIKTHQQEIEKLIIRHVEKG